MKNGKIKMLFNRAIAILVSASIISFTFFPAVNVQADINTLLSYFNDCVLQIMADGGFIYQASKGDMSAALENLYISRELGEKTYVEYIQEHFKQDETSGSYTIDAELYNLIQQFLESLKDQKDDQGNPVAEQVDYLTLYLPAIGDAFDPEIDNKGFKGVFSPKRILSDSAITDASYIDFCDVMHNKVENILKGWDENRNSGWNRMDLIKILPWYMDFQNNTEIGYQYKVSWFYQYYQPDNDPVYIVSNLKTMYLNNERYGFTFYHNTENGVAYLENTTNTCVNVRVGNVVYKDSIGNFDSWDYSDFGNSNSFNYMINSNQNLAEVSNGFDDEIHYVENGDYYYIPTLRSLHGTYIKVFRTAQDLQKYVNGGGNSIVSIDKSKHVKTVTITNDNHVEYNYYAADDPDNPDNKPADPEPGTDTDYSSTLQKILKQLQEIKKAINDLDTSGGSGTGEDIAKLEAILAELQAIKASMADISKWTDEDISTLWEQLDLLLEDTGEIIKQLKAIKDAVDSNTNVLRSILSQVTQINAKIALRKTINDTNNNLDWLIEQLANLIENGLSIPEEISEMLGTKFPFSLPYIMVAILNLLEAPAEAPVFTLPLNWNIDDVDYMGSEEFVLDFSEFSEVADAIKFFITLEWIMLLLRLTPRMLSNGKEIEDNTEV